MSILETLAVLIIGLVILAWRITWLAGRVQRVTVRAERAWSALDAALVGRAQRATELATTPGIDPATALLVLDAAAAALEPDLCRGDRERAESDLSHVLDAVDPMLRTSPGELASERARVSICRRLHNDAVATALSLRRRYTVRLFRLAGRTAEPRTFEIAEGAIYTVEPRTPAGRKRPIVIVREAEN